jgi:hypothetical protein
LVSAHGGRSKGALFVGCSKGYAAPVIALGVGAGAVGSVVTLILDLSKPYLDGIRALARATRTDAAVMGKG